VSFLHPERAALDAFFPGLAAFLRATPLAAMERPGNPALGAFRAAGGPGLLIPERYGGRGAAPVHALRVQRALGGAAPSLAVATTMHHFSVACIVELARESVGMEPVVLEQIAGQNLYVASGVAEGRAGAGALSSEMKVRAAGDGWVLSGSKRPCSLSHSMDLLTASFRIPAGPRAGELAFATIPAQTPGIERRPFWECPALAGAESDEVVLHDVAVPGENVSYLDREGRLLAHGFLWFELLISAAYLGIADALVAMVLDRGKGTPAERAGLALEHEAAMAALEGVARAMDTEGPALLSRALCVRYAVQQTIERTSARAAELLGGLAFLRGGTVALLYTAARMLAFHPPSRAAMGPALDHFFQGGPLLLD
jgi:alkylation response protein AidB-like acyl-CoA dehydrogenase